MASTLIRGAMTAAACEGSRSAEAGMQVADADAGRTARESASDSTSGDDDDDDGFLQKVAEVVKVPLHKEFQEETVTDWRARMQTRLQLLKERARLSGGRSSVVYAVPEGEVVGRDYVRNVG